MQVNVSNGFPPFSYTLTDASSNIILNEVVIEDSIFTFNNLLSGTYIVEVTSSNGIYDFVENVTINEWNPIIEMSHLITPVTCGGSIFVNDLGAIDLEISGESGTYTYTLVEASNLSERPLIPVNTISSNPITTPTEVRFEGVNFGQYYIFVENLNDINGCSQVFFGPYNVFSPPNDLDTTIVFTASCVEGVIAEVYVNGGSGINPPVNPPPGFDIRLVGETGSLGEFQALNDLPESITVVDQVTPIRKHAFTSLEFNRSYIIEVRDNATNCTYQEILTPISPPNEPRILNFTATNTSCGETLGVGDGMINFEISEYDPSVTQVSWEVFDRTTNVSLGEAYTGIASNLNGANVSVVISNFSAGLYYLLVREDNITSCPARQDFVIASPTVLQGVASIVSGISCSNEADAVVKIEISGGTPPYSFASSINPSFFYSDAEDGIDGEHTFTGVSTGTYDFLAQDANGCSEVFNIIIDEVTEIEISIAITPVSTNDDGVIVVNASGGAENYTYELLDASGTNILVPSQSSNTFVVSTSGDYTVRLTDGNDCTRDQFVSVETTEENPILDYADEILFCTVIGQSYPVITIEDENGEVVDILFANVLSVVWQQLNEISCNVPIDETCPTTDVSCVSDWFDFETGSSFVITEPGEYRVVITFNTRSRMSTKIYYFRANGNLLGVDDINVEAIKLYPNPGKTMININTEVKEVRVFDVSGKIIFKSSENIFDISALAKGIYFTEVQTIKGAKTIIKLLKE